MNFVVSKLAEGGLKEILVAEATAETVFIVAPITAPVIIVVAIVPTVPPTPTTAKPALTAVATNGAATMVKAITPTTIIILPIPLK